MKINKTFLRQIIKEQLDTLVQEQVNQNVQTILDMIQALPTQDRAILVKQVRSMDSSGMTADQAKSDIEARRAAIKSGQGDPALRGSAGAATPPPPPPKSAVDPNKPQFRQGMDPKTYLDQLKAYRQKNPIQTPAKVGSNVPPPPPAPPKPVDTLKKNRGKMLPKRMREGEE